MRDGSRHAGFLLFRVHLPTLLSGVWGGVGLSISGRSGPRSCCHWRLGHVMSHHVSAEWASALGPVVGCGAAAAAAISLSRRVGRRSDLPLAASRATITSVEVVVD